MVHSIRYRRSSRWTIGLGAGLLVGLIVGMMGSGIWPNTPLHAVSTDRTQTFAMATGPVDQDIEAVFFLDFPTGDLKAMVLNQRGSMFTAFYARNVLADLGVDPSKNPQFMMVTGGANLRGVAGASRIRPGLSVVYVAEVTTGRVAAYGIPWSRQSFVSGQAMASPAPIALLAVMPFRATAAPMAPPAPGM